MNYAELLEEMFTGEIEWIDEQLSYFRVLKRERKKPLNTRFSIGDIIDSLITIRKDLVCKEKRYRTFGIALKSKQKQEKTEVSPSFPQV